MAFHSGPGQFTFDEATGALLTTGGGGGGTQDVNIIEVLGNPIALGNPVPVELSDGTNPVGTVSNPLSVNVISGGGSNASVGLVNNVAPTSATQVGGKDPSGALQALLLDNFDNLLVANLLTAGGAVNVTWDNTTPQGSTSVNGNFSNYVRAIVQLNCSNDLVGGVISFQTGSAAHYVTAALGRKLGTYQTATQFTLVAGQTFILEFDLADYSALQATLATALSAGSVNVNITVDNGPLTDMSVGQADGSKLHVTVDNATSGASTGLVGVLAPTSATEIGAVNSLGLLTALQSDPSGNLMVGFNQQMLTVFQELLSEMRMLRRLHFLLYEETGEGNPTLSLADDPSDVKQVDYQ